ncbi:MAG TPA: leader peptide processing enzyme [Treponemataceae bacterium]|jgi:membrane protein YdbS with pleckstrin-like domain|nr:leader peptide processing enzyme [Treponemataceae bacterium]
MTNKQRTIIFILAGTVVSVLITLILVVVFFLGTIYFLKDNPETVGRVFPFVFLAAIVLGMFIYQKIVKFVITKFKLEDKLDPLFGPKKKSKLD